MSFILPKLAEMLLRPSMLLLLCALAGLALRRPALAWLGVAGLLAVVLLPLGELLLRPLEDRYPRPPPPARVDGVVVLGGALEQDIFADRGIPSLNGAAERMTELAALAQRYPHARLVFTGGSGHLLPEAATEADDARALFTALGVPPARMTYESASRTTWENAVFTRRLAAPKPGETWLLVTSAMHMPRALGTFRAAGWDPLPWPVAYKTLHQGFRWEEEPGERIGLFDAAAHEWLGLLAYRLEEHWTAQPIVAVGNRESH
jgi:uncharacterized SAM-binding protein YcdF (DUF218 family)